MPIVAYQHSLASPGFAPDTAHGQLPPQVWTDGENMSFINGAPRTIEGSEAAHTITTSLIHMINVYTATSNYWVAASKTALFQTDGSTVSDITRVSATTTVIAYSATDNFNWTMTSFGNFLIANNGVNVPQALAIGAGSKFANLTGWPATYVAQSVRTYRNYLVAMDITIGSDRYPSLVMWSDAATYDALPSTWTPATTNDAGDNNLNDTPGFIIDGLTLGGSFLIYKEDSVWAMTFVAGSTVMAFRKLFDGVGLLTKRCIQEFNGKHFFVARGDIYITDGVTQQSVATGRVRDLLFSSISGDTYSRVFTAIDRSRREIWVCYPTTRGFPDTALIWNYETDTWYPPRSIKPTAHIAAGVVNVSGTGTTFDADVGTFDGGTAGPFDERSYNPSQVDLLAARPTGATLDRLNEGTLEAGVTITGYLSRKLLPFVGQDASGGPSLWSPVMKVIRRLWVDATGTGTVRVYLGVHKHESDAPVWYGPYRIDLASQNFVWTLLRGRFFSIKFEADSGSGDWALTGYKLEYEVAGGF
jgi:hypothetical protein